MIEVKKYRMKPVVKEAVQFLPENAGEVAKWVGDNGGLDTMTWGTDMPAVLTIRTHMGDMDANIGDWVIRGLEGEFYPVQDSKFQLTYEEIVPDPLEEAIFSTEAVLSAVTGVLVCDDFGEVCSVLDFVLGRSHFTHQLPAAADEAKPIIVTQYPWLADVHLTAGSGDVLKGEVNAIIDLQGTHLTLTPKEQA